MGLIDEPRLLEFRHNVADRGRAPAVTVRKAVRKHARSDRLASDEVLLDQSGQQDFGARV
jgi:hypothetical protein